jgi:hypothetical protein
MLRIGMGLITPSACSGGPFGLGLRLSAARVWWNDGQSATGHAQQHGRTLGVPTRREPADVVGSAVLAFQHVGEFSTSFEREYVRGHHLDAWL